MTVQTVTTTVTESDLVAISGSSEYSLKQLLLERDLNDALTPYDVEVWLGANTLSPSIEAGLITDNCRAVSGKWTAANTSMTRVRDPLIMDGRYRWQTTDQAAEGMRGNITQGMDTWDGYTMILPDVEIVASDIVGLFNVGDGAADRVMLYVNSTSVFLYNSTSSVRIDTGGGITFGQRHSIMATYRASDGLSAIYLDSATPAGTGNILEPPSSDTVAAILGSSDDALDGAALASQAILLRQAVTDTNDIETIMSICAQIRA